MTLVDAVAATFAATTVPDLDPVDQLAALLADVDGHAHRYATDPIVADLYRIEAEVLLPVFLAAVAAPPHDLT